MGVGRVGRPHGLAGAFVVDGASSDAERFAVGADLFAAGANVRVVESKQAGGRRVIRLDRVVERGAELEVSRDQLPPPEADSYYVFQLVGLEAVEEGGRPLGRVVDVAPGVANDVLELDSGLQLPLVEACVTQVELNAGRITIATGFAEPG
ncbi:MAG: 16S rRNA processing protein RimM [Actinobacteria bacterium]|nr:16S rRNA processing protein RimM [Actinomycetota bacterium]